MPPVQQDLAEDLLATVEYLTQFSKFQNVSCLWLFFPDNHGADHTIVNYIGLSGVATEHKRRRCRQCTSCVPPQTSMTR